MPDDPVRPAGSPAGRTIPPRGAALALAAAFGGWIFIPLVLPDRAPDGLVILLVEGLFIAAALAVAAPSPRAALGLRLPTAPQALWIILAGMALAFALAEAGLFLQEALPKSWQFEEVLQKQSARYQSMHPVTQALTLVVAAAVGEEFLYRGVLARSWTAWRGPWFGVLASAVVFALLHVVPVRVAVTFVLGVHFGVIAIRTGRLGGAILAHAVNNSVAVWGNLGNQPQGDRLAIAASAYAVLLAVGWKLQGRRGIGTS